MFKQNHSNSINRIRRELLRQLIASSAIAVLPTSLRAADSIKLKQWPFALGVASGCPTQDGVILWTRLILDNSFTSAVINVQWEIASDERMRNVIARGSEYASSEWAHSVHAEVRGLKPNREYWYRFTAGGQQSIVGRTRTAPALDAKLNQLRIAVASCQKYENGYYTAYEHMHNDAPDLVIHCGDYIYEGTGGNDLVRGDGSHEATTLEQYRARYALYKADEHLQAMHASCPWLVTWDDHEVVNDYAGETSYDDSGETFLARRAAAYRAYYEHMPLPKTARPVGPSMNLYRQQTFGSVLTIYMLDSRQHRSPLACLGEGETDGPGAMCRRLYDAARTKLGFQQERWLRDQLQASHSRWNFMVNGTPMAHVDLDPGPDAAYRRDSWDGYPAARQRFLDMVSEIRPTNPIVVDGDIHAFQVANLNARANDLNSPVIASEFTTTSITSPSVSQQALDRRRESNPNVLLSDARKHGYLLLEINDQRAQADLVTVSSTKERTATRGVLARYNVENGVAGPVKVG